MTDRPPSSDSIPEQESSQNSGESRWPSWSWKLLESAGLVAGASAFFYFMGYSYYAGFFKRLSFPRPFPELAPSEYFSRAFTDLVTIVPIVIFIIVRVLLLDDTSRIDVVKRRAIPIVLVPISLLLYAWIFGFLNPVIVLLLAPPIVGGIFAIIRPKVDRYMGKHRDFFQISLVLVSTAIAVLFLSIYFQFYGGRQAELMLERRVGWTPLVSMQLREPNPSVEGKSLLLVLLRDNRYYLAQPESPAPRWPELFIVPESEVLFAETQAKPVPSSLPVEICRWLSPLCPE